MAGYLQFPELPYASYGYLILFIFLILFKPRRKKKKKNPGEGTQNPHGWYEQYIHKLILKEKFLHFSSVQSLSHVRLCDPMDCRTPGLPVHHQLPGFIQTHVHQVNDASQPLSKLCLCFLTCCLGLL